MSAFLLNDGRVQRPFLWIFSLPTDVGGTGDSPLLKVVEWASQSDYDVDRAAMNMDHGAFNAIAVPGFSVGGFANLATITAALEALGGDYTGLAELS